MATHPVVPMMKVVQLGTLDNLYRPEETRIRDAKPPAIFNIILKYDWRVRNLAPASPTTRFPYKKTACNCSEGAFPSVARCLIHIISLAPEYSRGKSDCSILKSEGVKPAVAMEENSRVGEEMAKYTALALPQRLASMPNPEPTTLSQATTSPECKHRKRAVEVGMVG